MSMAGPAGRSTVFAVFAALAAAGAVPLARGGPGPGVSVAELASLEKSMLAGARLHTTARPAAPQPVAAFCAGCHPPPAHGGRGVVVALVNEHASRMDCLVCHWSLAGGARPAPAWQVHSGASLLAALPAERATPGAARGAAVLGDGDAALLRAWSRLRRLPPSRGDGGAPAPRGSRGAGRRPRDPRELFHPRSRREVVLPATAVRARGPAQSPGHPRVRTLAPFCAAVAVAVAIAAAAGPAAAGCIPARQLFAVREASGIAFRQPSDLVLAGDRLLVLDDLNGRVAILDLKGHAAGSIPLPGGTAGSWLGIGLGGADEIFVASAADSRVVVLDRKGKQVREFPTGGADGGGRPTGVLVAAGSCYVVDAGEKQVQSFALDGRPLAAWGSAGDGPSQFRAPFRIAQDGLGRLLVSDALNSRVLAFTPAGAWLAALGEFGVTEGTLFRPAGLAVLAGDRVLVADNHFGSLQIFDAQGGYQGVLCGGDGRPLALENPTGVAARGGSVYVVEMGAGQGERVGDRRPVTFRAPARAWGGG